MSLNREKQGELFIFSELVLWSLYPVITIISFNKLSPLVSLAISTAFSAIFFAGLLTLRKKWHELKNTSAMKDIFLVSLINGVLFYLFSFFGLRYTSAGNASIIALIEVFFTYLFFHVWRKDYLPTQHALGAILTVTGAIIVLYPNIHNFAGGDLLIVAAAAVAPFGNFFQQRVRKTVSSESIMFIRSVVASIVLFALTLLFQANFDFTSIKESLVPLLINGIFLFGLAKILWIEGIHRMSVTKASALSSTSPLLTLFFAWILLKNIPTTWQLLSFIPMFLGVILLSVNKNNQPLQKD